MISTLFEIAQLVILVIALVFFVVAIEYRKLSFAIIAFAVANSFLSLSFFALGAPVVAVFNLSVFSGAFVILFLAMMSMEAPEDEGPEVTDAKEVAQE